MPEEQEACDPEDVLCQLDLLVKMRNLQGAFADKTFQEKFFPTNQPLLEELNEKLKASIAAKEVTIQEKLEICNLPPLEEIEPEEKEE